MTVYILFFIFHVIIYRPRVCNKHLNKFATANSNLKLEILIFIKFEHSPYCHNTIVHTKL